MYTFLRIRYIIYYVIIIVNVTFVRDVDTICLGKNVETSHLTGVTQ